MGAGRQPGRADIADHLALADPCPGGQALGEAGLVAVKGLVAVGVAHDRHVAVAGIAPDLLDDAVAGGEDRRAARRSEIDAGMHPGIFEDRMTPGAEAGAEHAGGDRLPHQELLGALPLLVIVVDDPVVGRPEAVEALGRAVEGERREQHFGLRRIGGILRQRVEDLDRIARSDAGLEVDVVGEDADQLVDQVLGHLLLERGLVDGVVEAGHRPAIDFHLIAVDLGELAGGKRGLVGTDEDVVVGARHGRLVGALVVDAHPERDEDALLGAVAGIGKPNLLADMDGIEIDELRQRVDDQLGILVGDVVLGEELAEALALLDGDEPLAVALEAEALAVVLGDVRDVLGDDLHAHRREGILGGELVAGAARIDEGERGHVGLAGPEIGGSPHDRLDVGARHHDPRVLAHLDEREVGDLHRHLAVDLGAVELVVGGGLALRGALLVGRFGSGRVGEDAKRVVFRNFVGVLRRRRGQRGDDAGEGAELDEVLFALLGHGGDLEHLAARDGFLGRAHAVALPAEGDRGIGVAAGDAENFRAGGELIGIVERGHEGAAHEEGGGDACEDGAAQPAHADAARGGAVVVLATDEKRGLDAEIHHVAVRRRAQAGSAPHARLFSPNRPSPGHGRRQRRPMIRPVPMVRPRAARAKPRRPVHSCRLFGIIKARSTTAQTACMSHVGNRARPTATAPRDLACRRADHFAERGEASGIAADGGRGDAEAGDRRPAEIENRGGGAADAELMLLVIEGIAALPDPRQLLGERRQGGDRVGREGREPAGPDAFPEVVGIEKGEERLADAGAMGGIARADHRGHAEGVRTFDLVDIDHIEAVEDREVDGLARPFHQPRDHRLGLRPYVDPVPGQPGELEGAGSEAIAPVLVEAEHALLQEIGEQPVERRLRQSEAVDEFGKGRAAFDAGDVAEHFHGLRKGAGAATGTA